MEKILIVDDHIGILRLLSLELMEKGYQVVTASNGKEALQKFRYESPGLVLLDIVMPVMDGLDVIPMIREFSCVPIIAHSFDANNKNAALKLGANDFLLKPFDTDVLFQKINRLLNQPAPRTQEY